MKKNYDSYGGFLPLEIKQGEDFYSSQYKHIQKFNSAKAALNHFLNQTQIDKLYVPYYLCPNVCKEIESHGMEIKYYKIDSELLPLLDETSESTWIYIVDYFGIMDRRLDAYVSAHRGINFIIDNCHSFFHKPLQEVCIYSCKKFFGVPDGAYLISPDTLEMSLNYTVGNGYAGYLLKCLEMGTNECYSEKKDVDKMLGQNYAGMSKLADIILHGIDYEYVIQKRRNNMKIYNDVFQKVNRINIEDSSVPYVYPLNFGKNIKDALIAEKIFVPTLWEQCKEDYFKDTWEYDLTENTLFLPVDQRYNEEDINYIVSVIKKYM